MKCIEIVQMLKGLLSKFLCLLLKFMNVKRFKEGREDIEDNVKTRIPITSISDENV